jgi:hypothetical protein
MRRTIFHWAFVACLQATIASVAHAQLIDDIELRREGSHAVVQLHFVTPVQFQRSVTHYTGETVEVFYSVLPTSETLNPASSERRIEDIQGLPKVTITDAGDRINPSSRKLTLRFSTPTRQRVRGGNSRQSIDVVLEGLGAAVSTAFLAPAESQALIAPESSRPPQAVNGSQRYAVSLERSSEPAAPLMSSIPAEFQDNVVFTLKSVVGGKPVYEVILGYFATMPAVESARGKLLRRFPNATIVAVQSRPPAAAPAPAPAAAVAAAAAAAIRTPAITAVPVPVAPAAGAAVAAAKPQVSVPTPGAGVAARPAAVPAPAAAAAKVSAEAAPAPGVTPAAPVAPTSVSTPPAPVPGPAAAVAAVAAPSPAASAEVNGNAATLLAGAQAAYERGDYPTAIETLNALLALPNNNSSRPAQELIGHARLKTEDMARARSEFELFLQLYPTGADSDRVRKVLNAMPKPMVARPRAPMEPITTTSGSVSLYYFGGQSQVRTQDFQNSPISGLPVLQSESTISNADISQLQSNVDLNWRYRDADKDMRFVLRNNATADLLPSGNNRNRLTALYFDQRSFVNGTNFRVGRQSPTGMGILYRFDGIQAGYTFAPKWRVNAAVGKPSDPLLDTNRSFYGVAIESEALTKELGGDVYFNQGTIDGQIDRQAIGTELRYFNGGVSMFGQIDYDQVLQSMNIVSLQGNWMFPDNSMINFMYDRRATPFRALGNILFFQDPTQPLVRTISDLLQTNTVDTLRTQLNAVTAIQTQAMFGFTTPITRSWQVGSNVTYTNVGEILPVPVILPNGQPSTGDLWSLSGMLIGSNLYSIRDTHVFNITLLTGPTYNGTLLSYNNLTSLTEKWQLEPSLRYYTQTDNTDTKMVRWTPGMRLTYRVRKQVSVESEFTYEISETNGPLKQESSTRLFYYLGARYDF